MTVHTRFLKNVDRVRLLAGLGMLLFVHATVAQTDSRFEPRYHSLYLFAKTNWSQQAPNFTNAWVLARAAFDLAEFATNDTRRAQLAVEGIDAARSSLRLNEECAPAHYYLAMNLGQLARTRLLGALKLVGEMEKHFALAASLDPLIDHAGPDRNLGTLYREAPGWPASVGSRSKARTHLKKAIEHAPGFPGNQLAMLEAHLDWNETRAAEKLAQQIEQSLTDARQEFAGEEWEWAWDDWSRLWESLRGKLRKPTR
jgi:hypothetical protein